MTMRDRAGFVLAGGKSTRMGRDKALLPFRGERLIDRIARTVEQAAGSAAIVGAPAMFGTLKWAVIPDRIAAAGPLGGIHAALASGRAECNLIVACDMPMLDVSGLRELLDEADRAADADVLLPEANGQSQPLCAVYRSRCLPNIESALREGERKIQRALGSLRVSRFAAPSDLFVNVNTPAEWAAVGGL